MPLVQKLQLLDLPDHVFKWLVDYFEERGHATRLGDAISLVAGINASIIQFSVVGPPSYVIVASDLHPKPQRNAMTKYADDTCLMIGSSNIHTTAEEVGNIQAWATRNNLQINANKTEQMIIFRRRSKPVTYTSDPRGRACDGFEGSRYFGRNISFTFLTATII